MSRQLTDIAHDYVAAAVHPGDHVVDATVGNGHDTVFLADLVGPQGRVFGFDVQALAIQRTGRLLEDAAISHVELIHASHAEMAAHVPSESNGELSAVMFNLGYMPGSDKSIITQPDSTRFAIQAALGLLRAGGIVTVMAYPAHHGGQLELDAVEALIADLPPSQFQLIREPQPRPTAPHLFVVQQRSIALGDQGKRESVAWPGVG